MICHKKRLQIKASSQEQNHPKGDLLSALEVEVLFWIV